MVKNVLLKIVILLSLSLSLSLPSVSFAGQGFGLDFELGYPFMSVNLPPTLQPPLGSAAFVGLEASKTLDSLPIGLGLFNRIFIGGKFSSLPLLQSGISVYFYPFARPERSWQVDEGVSVRSSSTVLYGKLQGGIEFMNFRNPGDGAVFGAAAPMYAIGIGANIPTFSDQRAGLELAYTSSLGATDANGNSVTVYGILLSVHFSFYMY